MVIPLFNDINRPTNLIDVYLNLANITYIMDAGKPKVADNSMKRFNHMFVKICHHTFQSRNLLK